MQKCDNAWRETDVFFLQLYLYWKTGNMHLFIHPHSTLTLIPQNPDITLFKKFCTLLNCLFWIWYNYRLDKILLWSDLSCSIAALNGSLLLKIMFSSFGVFFFFCQWCCSSCWSACGQSNKYGSGWDMRDRHHFEKSIQRLQDKQESLAKSRFPPSPVSPRGKSKRLGQTNMISRRVVKGTMMQKSGHRLKLLPCMS